MSLSPKLGITMLTEGQASAEVTLNEALVMLETALQASMKDFTSTTPASPADGDAYYINGSGSGYWLGHDNQIAVFYGGWLFMTPKDGWIVFNQTDGKYYRFDLGSGGMYPVVDSVDGNLTNSTTGSAGSTVNNVGSSFNQTTLNNNFATLTAAFNQLKTQLRGKGIIN